jgi:hypothetical protein
MQHRSRAASLSAATEERPLKHFAFTRWLPCLLIALCPPLLGQCGGDVTHGTETGNPPVVEEQKLHIVLHDTGIEVVGDAGAVTPGASVRVTNRTTGQSAEATARSDGSVSVVVAGSMQDEYEVTVSNNAGSQTVQITAQTSGAAGAGGMTGTRDTADAGSTVMTIPSGPDPVACAALQRTLGVRVAAGFANADRRCQRDEECTTVDTGAGCFHSCEPVIVSTAGAEAARASIAQDIAALCDDATSQGCELPRPACARVGTLLACNAGTCTTLSSLTCDDIPSAAVRRKTNAIDAASRSCSRDSDCTLTQLNLTCIPSCGNTFYSVASSALEQLLALVEQTDGIYCSAWRNRACPGLPEPPCAPPTQSARATCASGQCDIQYVPLP